ncbi:MAG: diguanylate cyclase [Myxococcota bacterium]|jgi:diguanylate cyclase (GGDEF)-like protein|nr:diguanylate cyclase [Myxococcota bacterium]
MRVLIADDDAVSRKIIQTAVERLGHESVIATDGHEAWTRYLGAEFDVIISDWMMPGMDGLELCRKVRAEGGSLYTYFIVLSALGERKDRLTGMLAGADDYLTKPLDFDDLQVRLFAAARVTSLHKKLAAQKAELLHLNEELFQQSRRDPLTKVGNRLRLQEDLETMAARVRRYHQCYAVALCDVDFFKSYNDTYGHQAGDETLVQLAEVIVALCRAGDQVYRYGGEEFVIVYPEQTVARASEGMARILAGVVGLQRAHRGNPAGVVTISAGIAELGERGTEDVDLVLRRADAALYSAKQAGRNRLAVFAPEMLPESSAPAA